MAQTMFELTPELMCLTCACYLGVLSALVKWGLKTFGEFKGQNKGKDANVL